MKTAAERFKIFLGLHEWEYGTIKANLNDSVMKARRCKLTGVVQIILWKTGDQQYKKDFWYPMHSDHWHRFKLQSPTG